MQLTRRFIIQSAAASALLPSSFASAEGTAAIEVQMLNVNPENKKQRMVFLPRVIKVNPGDTVVFKSVDKGHNSEAIKGMVPDGAEMWKGKLSKDVEVVFDTPGVYGYKCTPHVAMGMVGLVVVEGEGKLDNLEAAKAVKQRGRSKKAFEELWAEAEAAGYLDAPVT